LIVIVQQDKVSMRYFCNFQGLHFWLLLG